MQMFQIPDRKSHQIWASSLMVVQASIAMRLSSAKAAFTRLVAITNGTITTV